MAGAKTTIFALATPPGRGGVAVIRVSGPGAYESAAALTLNRPLDAARMAQYCTLYHPITREILDQAIVLPFKAPASYTGEDVVEYHLHGGKAVVDSVLQALAKEKGHRIAEPGEFTRRAFENGKMDLTAAEAVADLIDAQTQAQKIQALSQMGGALNDLYSWWTEDLKGALAHLEADIEFPDEDLPEALSPQVLAVRDRLLAEISEHLDDNGRGERLRDGIQVVILGAPNAGKSSLLNSMAVRDVAIVSDMAGTTRDVIDVHLDVGGYPVILSDTAGLRPEQLGVSPQDMVEGEGIRRALERAKNADIMLLVFDGTDIMPDPHTLNLIDDRAILVTNKMDDVRAQDFVESSILVSAKTGAGVPDLLKRIKLKIENDFGVREVPSLTRRRHRAHVEEALAALQRACDAALPELVAEDLRLALRALGRITGRVDVEDLLDVIFKDFCIGK